MQWQLFPDFQLTNFIKPIPSRPYGGLCLADRQAKRRQRLIAAAIEVFGRQGVLNTPVRLICAQARLSERYFYENFTSVDECFKAVYNSLGSEIEAEIATRAAAMSHDTEAQLRIGLTYFFEYIKANPNRARILLIDSLISQPLNHSNSSSQLNKYTEIARRLFKKLYPSLAIEVNIELVVGGFTGMVIQTASIWVEGGFKTSVDCLVNHNIYAWVGLNQWLILHSTTNQMV